MDPLEYLFTLDQFGIKLGLHNIRTVCAALGNPQDAYPSIIVAGTNGKGSATAMIDAALRAAGHRSARYTSPHLSRIEERFVVDGTPVTEPALQEAVGDVRDVIARLRTAGALPTQPTYFEVATAAAFALFRRQTVDIAVLEVGLGGRFDATNVVRPIVSAITTIDLDHEQYLGSSIAEIAREKAGVIKPGVPAVVGESKAEALRVISECCVAAGAPLVRAAEGVVTDASMVHGRLTATFRTPLRAYEPVVLGLRGRHQLQNAILAIRVLEEVDRTSLRVPAGAVTQGLAAVDWPGRLDLMGFADDRRVVLDAAHNPAGAQALAAYLREVYPEGIPLVLGIMKDKDVTRMLTVLAPCATRVVCTQVAMSRAMPAEELAARLRQHAAVPVEAVPEPWRAVERAFGAGRTIAAAGSIFLIGDLSTALREHGAERLR